jgi:hypothetical protein
VARRFAGQYFLGRCFKRAEHLVSYHVERGLAVEPLVRSGAIVHEDLHAVGPSVGEQVGVVRACGAEFLNEPRKRRHDNGSCKQRR